MRRAHTDQEHSVGRWPRRRRRGHTETATEPRKDRERGAAMVELALVVVPLMVLLLGIIWFGVMLSFKQAVTQAAAAGARAAVPYSYETGQADARTAATNAANGPLGGWSHSCDDSKGTSCTISMKECTDANGTPIPGTGCVTVDVHYDYKDHPILPNVPILSSLLPSTISSTAVVQMNQ